MNSRKKPVDKSADFEEFIEQTSDYLPPSKQVNKENPTKTKKAAKQKKVYIGDLFDKPVSKDRIINTTLQLPENLNERLKTFCSEFNVSKNEVIRTLVEALLNEKGF